MMSANRLLALDLVNDTTAGGGVVPLPVVESLWQWLAV
jgi:hypothetical protein